MPRSRIVCLLQLLMTVLLLACPSLVQAGSDTWKFGLSSNWETPGSWTDGSTPTTTDTASLGFASTYTVLFGVAPAAIQNLTVNNGGTVTFTSSGGTKTLNVTGASGANTLNLGTNTSLTLGTLSNSMNLTMTADIAALSGSTLSVTNGSHLTANDLSAAGLGGTININGTGSNLTLLGSSEHYVGGSAGNGSISLNGGTASAAITGRLGLGDASVAATGSLSVGGNGTVVSGDIYLATQGLVGSSGTLSIAGTTTSLTQTAAGAVVVGSFSNGTATVTVGGTVSASLTIGSGGLGIRPTGSVNIGTTLNGTLTVNGDIFVTGGGSGTGLAIGNNGSLSQLAGRNMFLQAGGQFSYFTEYNAPAGQSYTIDGAGSKFQVTNGDFVLGANAVASVTNGGTLSGNYLSIGTNGNGTLTVDGANSTVIATGTFSNLGLNHSVATVTLSNGATGFFANGLGLASSMFQDSSASVTVKTGAHLNTGSLALAQTSAGGESPTATLTVRDSNSTVTLSAGSALTLSATSTPGNATLNVLDNGALTVGAGGSTVLYSGAVLNIDGGFVDLASLTFNGGTVNFTSGSLTYIGALKVGFGGLLGSDVNLGFNRILTLSNTATIDPFHTLTLSGGTLNVADITNNGTFNFVSGKLGFTGSFSISAGGDLGTSVALTAGQKITVATTTSISSAGVLYLNGGSFAAGGTLSNNGVIQIGSPASTLTGPISNTGTIQGVGIVAANITNSASIEAIGGTLIFTGPVSNTASGIISAATGNKILMQGASPFPTNAGLISLTGGTFDNGGNPLSNTGFITGYGTFRTGGIGLTNNGTVTFTGGTSTINGNVINAGGKTINIKYQPAIFTGNITNNGNIKITSTTITYTGALTNNPGSTYVSDPATNIFQSGMSNGGLMTGGPGDVFNFTAGTVANSGTFANGGTLQSSVNFTNTGAFTQSGPQLWSPGTTFTNNGAGSVANFLSDAGSNAAAPLNITINAGTVNFTATTQHLAALTVNAGQAIITSNPGAGAYPLTNPGAAIPGTMKLSALSFTSASAGTLDLKNNGLIIEAAGGNKASLIQQIALAINPIANGSAAIQHITSSTAATNSMYGVVVADNAELGLSSFGGLPVDANSILVTQALLGDANLDGVVNPTDLLIWAHNFNNAGSYSVASGDLNNDGVVNPTDLLIWAHNFNNSTAGGIPSSSGPGSLGNGSGLTPTAPVPEPATAFLILPALLLLNRRRRMQWS